MTHLPAGWAQTTLGEIGDYWNGRGFKKSEWRPTGQGRPIVRIQDLTGTGGLPNYFEGPVDERNVVRRGDLLVSWAATLGVYEWTGPEAVVNQHIFKVDSFVDRRFHRYLIESVLDSIRLQAHGSGMVHVTRSRFDGTPVLLPPLAEQQRIVAAIEKHFSHLGTGIDSLERARRNVERLRSLSFLSLLNDERWPWTTLGEIADVVGGLTKDAKRQSNPSFIEVPYLRVANVQRGYLDLRQVTTIRVPPEKAKALELQWGDILFNEGGDRDKLGRGWIWEGEIESCIHQNHVFRARLIDHQFDPKFISMHGNSFGQAWFEKMGKQTTNLASLNLKTLKAFPVPAPSLEEQRNAVAELERRLTTIDSTLRILDDTERRAQSLCRSILRKAFLGCLVTQDPEDEPASVLLDRIAGTKRTAPPRRSRRIAARTTA